MTILNNKLVAVVLFALASVFLASCGDDDDSNPTGPETKSIATIAAETDDLSLLVEALELTDLDATLDAEGTFTVLAPNNAAFEALLATNAEWKTLSDIPVNDLKNILLYHVLGTKVKSTSFTETYVKTMAVGPEDSKLSLKVTTTGGLKFNEEAKPIKADIEANNGVIHTIDKVILPVNIVEHILNNPDLSVLFEALADSRHTIDLVTILNQQSPYTLFAPTNAAFEALLATNPSWNSTSDIPIGLLTGTLGYHLLINQNVEASELQDGQSLETYIGSNIDVDLTDGAKLKTASGQTVSISVTDIQGTNGVIHVIDAVLLPQ